MRTTKPFSTISYNTPGFLVSKLDDLVRKRVLSFYTFVYHYAEEDEKKDHIHLLCIPNGTIQTDSITDLLEEFDPTHPIDPLGVKPWTSSKFGDWFLYCSHDTAYLASKGQVRKHHYPESDFVSSDSDYLHELVTTIDRSKYAKTQDFIEAIQRGVPFEEMCIKGQIPAPQFNQWSAMYSYVAEGLIRRNGRVSHSPREELSSPSPGEALPVVDPITGELQPAAARSLRFEPADDLAAATEELFEQGNS